MIEFAKLTCEMGTQMAILAYARVSTQDQDLSGQIEALTAAGATSMFKEKISGARADRVRVEALERVELLAGGGVQDWLPGDRLDRQGRAAPGIAVELGHDDPV